jgi:hypothetical protein
VNLWIRSGFVASLRRPGGIVTGFTLIEPTMATKWVELLKEIAPRVNRVAMLFNPATATYADYFLKPFKAAAPSFAVEAIVAPARDTSELESVIAAQAREPNGGLIVMPDSFTDAHREEITSLVARYRLPAIYAYRFFAALGGLLELTSAITFDARPIMSIAFSRARSLPIFQFSRRPNLNWRSISRPRKCLALPFHRRCLRKPTR